MYIHNLDPVLLDFGFIAIRWYSLAYIFGLILGWWYGKKIINHILKNSSFKFNLSEFDDLITYLIISIIIGGRLGYVIIYNSNYYFFNPIEIIKIWEGGMSFHGGMLGVVAAILFCAHRFELKPLALADEVAVVAPIGLFFGRIANFINGELFGRVTSHPFGIVFPNGGPEPRHPSQIYEAVFEGAVLFILLLLLSRIKQRFGLRNGVVMFGFLSGYGMARFCIEFVRAPDSHIGFFTAFGGLSLTMGQLLSLPMILIGIAGITYTIKTRAIASDA